MEGQEIDLPKTWKELFEKLLPLSLAAGVSILDYWDLTLAEIIAVLTNYRKMEEKRANETAMINYNQAVLIADFVGLRLNGKPLPSYQEIYPKAQTEEDSQAQKDRDYKAMMLQKEQWLFYAKRHNANRKKKLGGDGL